MGETPAGVQPLTRDRGVGKQDCWQVRNAETLELASGEQ